MRPVRSLDAPSSRLTTATRTFAVLAYGSQNALMLNHAYSAGVTMTPNTMIHVRGTRPMRATSRRKTRRLFLTRRVYA